MITLLKNTLACSNCGSILQYENSDISEEQTTQDKYVECPNCGEHIYIRESVEN